jgi:hypothetical protein
MSAPVAILSSEPVQPDKTARSRRALLAGALGGIGAVIAGAVGRASPVRAEGEAMVVGGDYNDATSATILGNSTNTATVFLAQSTANGIGVYGFSNSNIGTKGESGSSLGVSGVSTSSTGVAGSSTTGNGIIGVSGSQAGVKGVSTSNFGVYGTATSGTGVRGESSSGTGIYGYTQSADNAALRTRNIGNGTGVIGVSGDVEPVAPTHTGVYGYAQQDSSSIGVWGVSANGHGVHGESDSGWAGYFDGKVFTNRFIELTEIAKPSTPDSNRARLFVRDNGSGHTQLCVRFHNGVVRILATA